MGGQKSKQPTDAWLDYLFDAVEAAMEDGLDRDRFLEAAGETWDDTEAENAGGGDVEAPK